MAGPFGGRFRLIGQGAMGSHPYHLGMRGGTCQQRCHGIVKLALDDAEILAEIDPAHHFILNDFIGGTGFKHHTIVKDIGAIHDL